MIRPRLAVALLLAACATSAHAHDAKPPVYDIISLQTEASADVPNDTMTATLTAEMEDTDPARLAQTINRVAKAALNAAADFKTIKPSTGNYQTFPVYDKNKLSHWRGRYALVLESAHFDDLTSLIGRLQGSMQLTQLSFSVSTASRQKMEDELVVQALQAFGRRADLVRTTLGAAAYRIRDLNISSGGGFPRPEMGLRAMSADAGVNPAVESGTSRIQITAGGSIQLMDKKPTP